MPVSITMVAFYTATSEVSIIKYQTGGTKMRMREHLEKEAEKKRKLEIAKKLSDLATNDSPEVENVVKAAVKKKKTEVEYIVSKLDKK